MIKDKGFALSPLAYTSAKASAIVSDEVLQAYREIALTSSSLVLPLP